MSKNTHIKVCIVTISLAKGGAERSTAILSQMLASKGFDVHLVILTNAIDYEYRGTLHNLGLAKEKDASSLGKIKRFIAFRNYIKKQKFDYIIDNRNRQFAFKEWMYVNYVYRHQKVIYVVRSFNLSQYFPIDSKVAKQMVAKASHIVGVSKAINKQVNKVFSTSKATTIYNPVPKVEVKAKAKQSSTYILFLGRLEENVKNFSLMLEAFAISKVYKQGISLNIMGEGSDKEFILKKAKELAIEDWVQLFPFDANIEPHILNAKFLTLTSHYEGFPRVLIESLAHGTPVVSVDCNSGPSEIVQHEHNGLLVENHNPEALAAAYKRMIEDEKLLVHCQENAQQSIAHLTFDTIASQWETLLQK